MEGMNTIQNKILITQRYKRIYLSTKKNVCYNTTVIE